MHLLLVNDIRYQEPFVKYLTKMVKQEVLFNYNPAKFQPFNDWLRAANIKTTADIVIKKSLEAIEYVPINTPNEVGYDIVINDKKYLDGTQYRIIDLINLIESGNTELQGQPIFSEAFAKVEGKINIYYRLFETTGVGVLYEYIPL